jgi:type VI secretion system protein ImpK
MSTFSTPPNDASPSVEADSQGQSLTGSFGNVSFKETRHRQSEDSTFELRGQSGNPMTDAAAPLVGLVIRLRKLDKCENISELYKTVHNQVSTVLEEIRRHNYDTPTQLAYSYALCLFIDEAVMATAWGKHSDWSQRSLLSAYHHETWGGEKFFTVLSRMLMTPEKYRDVLEFMYLCLCLGLKGKYSVPSTGDEELQKIIVRVHRVLRDLRGEPPERLTDAMTNVAPRHFRMRNQWPWWAPWAAATGVLMAAYAVYAVRLNTATQQVLQSLDGILKL